MHRSHTTLVRLLFLLVLVAALAVALGGFSWEGPDGFSWDGSQVSSVSS
jgi:hypothetical protein